MTGSVLILLAFLLAQAGRMDPAAWSYLWLNLAGSALTAGDALHEKQWGFLLLEGAWMIVSAVSLINKARGRTPRAPGH
ncbi:hypothetical protein GTY65_15840 [Streptomyces sp. SID8379]|nr:hypothetical protein [Streptomyces sp. SID8379]MYW65520.1 hypothetical protein [Streptomyces sp. SID8379]